MIHRATGRNIVELFNSILENIPEGYIVISMDTKLVNGFYVADYTLKQSLLNKVKALKSQSIETNRHPTITPYLLDEIISELEKINAEV